jgi:hypothetical protein
MRSARRPTVRCTRWTLVLPSPRASSTPRFVCMHQLKLLEEERGGEGGSGARRGGAGEELDEADPHPPACPAQSPPPIYDILYVLGGGAGRGAAGRGWVRTMRPMDASPPPHTCSTQPTPPSTVPACRVGVGRSCAEGVGGGQEIDEGLPTPPHLLYSTHPTQHCVCLPGGGGEELRGGGGRRAMCKFVCG